MDKHQPQVQAVRPVRKDNLNSPTITPAPTVYFDCHLNPATGKSFVLWDDIRIVFTDALYVSHEAKMIPFMKDADWMPLKPLRVAAIPDVVLDIVVDSPLVRLEAALQQTTLTDTLNVATVQKTRQETPQEDTALKLTISPVSIDPRYNSVYRLGETAMENYSHINHPDFRPKPRAPQFVLTTEQEEDSNEATSNASNIISEPVNANAQANNDKPANIAQSRQSPQDHTAAAAVRDISPIVVKASLGDAKSQVELGDMYRVGDGVEQDFEAARYWYLKAANQGDPSGQCNLGHLYRLELGVDRNHSTALSWYTKAADQGDAGGQCYVGLVHHFGLVGAMDYSAAMDWYLMAAIQGHAYAQYSIGSIYCMGLGVQQDYDKAMKWCIRAVDQGLPAAQAEIGFMYLTGGGVSKDETIALDWLRRAVSRKDVDVWAQFAMGVMYRKGLGVRKSESAAFPWFLKAARQGYLDAQHIVGSMYRDGRGIPQDYSEALVWFLKSANHNIPNSQYQTGLLYFQGQGVSKNYMRAKEWYVKAAKLGHKGAMTKLSEVQQLVDDEEAAKATEKKKSTSAKLRFW
ncbi:hypothetical protein BGZ90_002218 [Linnemannia elongata]|nr:hypothetical protein BGZ90_002218 [Linnemannia elongata]